MVRAKSDTLDNEYDIVSITDFAGGWITIVGALSLSSNQSPDMLNVLPLPGRLRFRGGYNNIVALPYAADAAFPFYDSANAKHYAVWAGGNLYDLVSGAVVTVASGVYTAGNRVGKTVLNGVLYWSCGLPNTVNLQYWNPQTPAHGAVTMTGSVTAIASNYLLVFLDSIVALAPTWNTGSGSVYQSNVYAWSVTNAPGDWTGTQSQAVGSNDGGVLTMACLFGIANTGVPPTRTMVVARNNGGFYSYTDALGSQVEATLNVPPQVGCLDGDTVQFLPEDQQDGSPFGSIVFLGSDGQVWVTNGINSQPVSTSIVDYLYNTVATTLAANPNQRFSSGYNEEWQYYWVDVAGTQFVYLWQQKAWTKFQGWPSGPTIQTVGLTGSPAIYVAGNGATPFFSQIALDNTFDNGVMPLTYWTSPMLHGGNRKMYKSVQHYALGSYDTGGVYVLSGVSNKREDGSYMQSMNTQHTAPNNLPASNAFIVGSSTLGGSNVLSGGTSALSGNAVEMQGTFACSVPEDEWTPAGTTETLKGNAVSVTITAGQGGQPVFDVLSLDVHYDELGQMRGAGVLFNPTGGTTDTFDPLVAAE